MAGFLGCDLHMPRRETLWQQHITLQALEVLEGEARGALAVGRDVPGVQRHRLAVLGSEDLHIYSTADLQFAGTYLGEHQAVMIEPRRAIAGDTQTLHPQALLTGTRRDDAFVEG